MGADFYCLKLKIILNNPKIIVDTPVIIWYILLITKEAVILYHYHNRIRQRINNGELVDYYFTDNYPRIGNALVLVFNTVPFLRPIRPHKWPQYSYILKKEVNA